MKWIIAIGLLSLLNCQTRQEQKQPVAAVPINKDSIRQQDSLAEEMDVQQEKYKKYWGYRFHIQGDFDGDGRQDTLTERLISGRTGQEIAKFCGFEKDEGPDCWWTWRINWFREPKCLLHSSNTTIQDFITTDSSVFSIGLIALQNVGDLNGDRLDEIVYVEDDGSCDGASRKGNLATFKHGKWQVIKVFITRLGGFPEFEQEAITIVNPKDLSKPVVKDFEQELKKAEPFFKRKDGKIFYRTYEGFGTVPEVWRKVKVNW